MLRLGAFFVLACSLAATARSASVAAACCMHKQDRNTSASNIQLMP